MLVTSLGALGGCGQMKKILDWRPCQAVRQLLGERRVLEGSEAAMCVMATLGSGANEVSAHPRCCFAVVLALARGIDVALAAKSKGVTAVSPH